MTEIALTSRIEVGITSIAYHVGEVVPIENIARLADNPRLLQRFKNEGFKNFCKSELSLAEQAVLAAKDTILKSGLSTQSIDAVVIGTSELRDWNEFPESFSKEILAALELNNVFVVGITLAGCANFASSLRVARNMIIADGYRNVLVIETNKVRGNLERLVGYEESSVPSSIFADGAVSFIVTSEQADFTVLGMDQIVSIFDGENSTSASLIAKNVACYRRVIARALAIADLTEKQFECVLFNNMNFKMMLGLLKVLNFSHANFYTKNIYRYSHLWSADNLINLHDYCEDKTPADGTTFMLLAQGNSYYSAVACRLNRR